MRLRMTAFFLSLSVAEPAVAQTTAADLIADAMSQRGYSPSQYSLESNEWPARYFDYAQGDYATYGGLRVTTASAVGGGQFVYLVVATNVSDRVVCVRGKVDVRPAEAVTGRNTANNGIQPGGHVILLAAGGQAGYGNEEHVSVAFWKPEPSLTGRYCSATQPPGLDEWANDGQISTFRGSEI